MSFFLSLGRVCGILALMGGACVAIGSMVAGSLAGAAAGVSLALGGYFLATWCDGQRTRAAGDFRSDRLRAGLRWFRVLGGASLGIAMLSGGLWLFAGWPEMADEHNFEGMAMAFLFTGLGAWMTGGYVTLLVAALMHRPALAMDRRGMRHFLIGRISWKDVQRVDAVGSLDWLRSGGGTLSLKLAPGAYRRVLARLSAIERNLFRIAVTFDDAGSRLDLSCAFFRAHPFAISTAAGLLSGRDGLAEARRLLAQHDRPQGTAA